MEYFCTRLSACKVTSGNNLWAFSDIISIHNCLNLGTIIIKCTILIEREGGQPDHLLRSVHRMFRGSKHGILFGRCLPMRSMFSCDPWPVALGPPHQWTSQSKNLRQVMWMRKNTQQVRVPRLGLVVFFGGEREHCSMKQGPKLFSNTPDLATAPFA